MRKLIAGNWKMNGTGPMAAGLAAKLKDQAGSLGCDVVLCPPATLLGLVAHLVDGTPIAVGGQDCHPKPAGAHTGDISAAMLREAGAGWVILGHSERRAEHGESDALVRSKVEAAAAVGLIPIVCVGETLAQRDSGDAEGVVGVQLSGSLPDTFYGVVAYEPVWAIGSGRAATPADVANMHGFIRNRLAERYGAFGRDIRILYGGSVKPSNAAELLATPEVGGALVGGASLVAEDFLAICRAAV